MCRVVRHFGQLLYDLVSWRKEFPSLPLSLPPPNPYFPSPPHTLLKEQTLRLAVGAGSAPIEETKEAL